MSLFDSMFNPLADVMSWAGDVLEAPASTYVPDDPPDLFVVVTRTGGAVFKGHDSPQFAMQVWAKSDLEAEAGAYTLALAMQDPAYAPSDPHCNAVGDPTIYSYGREDGGWYVWQVTAEFQYNLRK